MKIKSLKMRTLLGCDENTWNVQQSIEKQRGQEKVVLQVMAYHLLGAVYNFTHVTTNFADCSRPSSSMTEADDIDGWMIHVSLFTEDLEWDCNKNPNPDNQFRRIPEPFQFLAESK